MMLSCVCNLLPCPSYCCQCVFFGPALEKLEASISASSGGPARPLLGEQNGQRATQDAHLLVGSLVGLCLLGVLVG